MGTLAAGSRPPLPAPQVLLGLPLRYNYESDPNFSSADHSMFARLFLLFTLFPLGELAVLLWIGERTSWIFALSLVIVAALLGAWLVRQQSWRTIQRIRADLAAGRMPGDSLLDGLIVFAAAVLLIFPGVVSDLAAIGLLFPPTRAAFKRLLAAHFKARVHASLYGGPGTASYARRNLYAHDEIIDARVIDGRVVDAPASADAPPRR